MLKKVYHNSEKEFWIFTNLQGQFLHVDFNIGDTIDGYDFSDELRYYSKKDADDIATRLLPTIIEPVMKKKVVEKVSIETV